MTLNAAKDIFAKAMKVARERKLTPTEKKLLTRAQAVIRSHTRTTSANPKRKTPHTGYRPPQEFRDMPYKGYLIKFSDIQNMYWIEKDGFKIAWVPTISEAKKQIDYLATPNQPPKYYRFDLVKSRGKWYVKDFKTKKLVDGPFETDEQAARHLMAWRHSSENPKAIRTKHGTVRSKGERGSDYGHPRQTIRGKRFEPGDRVRFKSDKSLGTVTRAGAHSLTVRDDNGDSWQVTTADIVHSVAVKTGYKNPAGAKKIYGRCLRIEAVKTVNHTYGGRPTAAGQRYYHDFTTKNAKIYGLPNGDLLITTR